MKKKNHQKKKIQKSQTKKESKSFRESFDKFIQYRYLSVIIAGLYFIVLLVISLLYHKVGDYGVETDFFWSYVPEAKNFISGTITIEQFRGPMYPIFLGLIKILVSDYFISGILLGVISASILIFLTHKLIKKIISPVIAFFVTLILAFNPIFVQYTYSAGTDMVFNVLAAATVYYFFKDENLNYKNLISSAFFAGISYLTRYNGIFLLGFIFIILFVNYYNIDWFKRLKAAVIYLAVFILTFTPWGIYCHQEKGSFFYNENYKNIAYELFGKNKISWDQFWFAESKNFHSLFDVIGRDIPLFFSTIFGNIGEHFVLDMERLMSWYIGAFVVVGIIVLLISNPFKNWKSRETGYYLSNIFFFALLLLVFYSERFSIFLIPFYLLIAVQPFFREKFITYKKLPGSLRYIIVVVLVIVTFSETVSFNGSRIDSGPKELLVLQEWYQKNIPLNERGKKIAARKPHVAYLLDMEFSLLPMADSYDDLINKLIQNNVDYLYFSPVEAGMRKEFQDLLNPKIFHKGLEPVVYFNNPPAVLYKVKR